MGWLSPFLRKNLAVNQYRCGLALDSHSLKKNSYVSTPELLGVKPFTNRESVPLSKITGFCIISCNVHLVRKIFFVMVYMEECFTI